MARGRLGRGPRLALIALSASVALTGFTLWRAIEIRPVSAERGSNDLLRAAEITRRASDPVDSVLAVIDIDPFHPERRRPRVRFRMPGERVTLVRTARRPTARPRLALRGTVVLPGGGGLAIVDQGRGATTMVRVGERVGDLTLRSVDREQAVFTTPGGSRIVVRVRKAGG